MKKVNTVKAISAITYMGCAIQMCLAARYLIQLKKFAATTKDYNESVRKIKNRNK